MGPSSTPVGASLPSSMKDTATALLPEPDWTEDMKDAADEAMAHVWSRTVTDLIKGEEKNETMSSKKDREQLLALENVAYNLFNEVDEFLCRSADPAVDDSAIDDRVVEAKEHMKKVIKALSVAANMTLD